MNISKALTLSASIDLQTSAAALNNSLNRIFNIRRYFYISDASNNYDWLPNRIIESLTKN